MKRILPLLIILLLCSQIWAQDSRFVIGLNLKALTTNHWGDFNREYVNPIRGIYPGLNFEYVFHKLFSLKSGLDFERKGVSFDLVASDLSGTEQWNIHHSIYYEYISVPILLSYSSQGATYFYVNGGFFGGFLVKQISEFYSERDDSNNVEELEDSSKKYDAGLSFGAGINKPLGKRICVDLGVRNNLGLANIFLPESTDTESLRTNSFGIVLAINLKI